MREEEKKVNKNKKRQGEKGKRKTRLRNMR
jgi:hypothetical protein